MDTIEAYLNEPLVTSDQVKAMGGVLKWWDLQQETRPQLSQMAITYLSAPGAFIDTAGRKLTRTNCLIYSFIC